MALIFEIYEKRSTNLPSKASQVEKGASGFGFFKHDVGLARGLTSKFKPTHQPMAQMTLIVIIGDLTLVWISLFFFSSLDI